MQQLGFRSGLAFLKRRNASSICAAVIFGTAPAAALASALARFGAGFTVALALRAFFTAFGADFFGKDLTMISVY
jgi:hypothetical protein